MICLLLAVTTKSSAYRTVNTDNLIIRNVPSARRASFLCSTDSVSEYIDLVTTDYSPFSMKFARVGEITPPCGVPLMGFI